MADLPLFSRNGPVDGAKIGPREFLSAILVLTSKTDQEFCSHHFNVNLSFLGPKLAELPLFFRIGLITSSVELEMRRRVFLLGNPILTSKTNYFFSSHHFDPNLRSLGPKLSVLEPFLVLAKLSSKIVKNGPKKVKPRQKCWFSMKILFRNSSENSEKKEFLRYDHFSGFRDILTMFQVTVHSVHFWYGK